MAARKKRRADFAHLRRRGTSRTSIAGIERFETCIALALHLFLPSLIPSSVFSVFLALLVLFSFVSEHNCCCYAPAIIYFFPFLFLLLDS